jgi:hypothetical protein
MVKSIYGLFTPILFAACCILLFTACHDTEKHLADNSLVTIKVVLPDDNAHGFQSGGTRSGAKVQGSEAESKINTLKFLIYNQAGTEVEIYKSIKINADWTSDDPMWDATGKYLRIPLTQGNKRIYCIANWADPETADMPVIDKSTAGNVTTLLAMERKHDGVKLANPPVMTASLPSVSISAATQNLSIELKRQIARIELSPNLSQELALLGAHVKITGIKFKNLPTKAYLFPRSPLASPSATGQWNQSDFIEITPAQPLKQTAIDLETKCYIPEYKPEGQSTATVMVIRADFNGRTLYYDLVINPAVSASPAHTAFEIERNHTYRYKLTILGEGYASETRSTGNRADANLTYKLEIK